MHATLQIRDARPDEFAAASAAIRAAYMEYQPHFPPERWDTMLSRFADVWGRAADSELLVAVREDMVLAACRT
ncbi:MAG: hypothetical protein EXR27_17455 [Betaproteobacteria bacterium]|nr:hypothetical protein [Betaproteobacteria bacterium]